MPNCDYANLGHSNIHFPRRGLVVLAQRKLGALSAGGANWVSCPELSICVGRLPAHWGFGKTVAKTPRRPHQAPGLHEPLARFLQANLSSRTRGAWDVGHRATWGSFNIQCIKRESDASYRTHTPRKPPPTSPSMLYRPCAPFHTCPGKAADTPVHVTQALGLTHFRRYGSDGSAAWATATCGASPTMTLTPRRPTSAERALLQEGVHRMTGLRPSGKLRLPSHC